MNSLTVQGERDPKNKIDNISQKMLFQELLSQVILNGTTVSPCGWKKQQDKREGLEGIQSTPVASINNIKIILKLHAKHFTLFVIMELEEGISLNILQGPAVISPKI